MNKKIVLSIEQMQHLEDLGLDTSDASMWWGGEISKSLMVVPDYINFDWDFVKQTGGYPTYTLQDIIEEHFPKHICINGNDNNTLEITRFDLDIVVWYIGYTDYTNDPEGTAIGEFFEGESLLDVAYEMLCYLLENNQIRKSNQKKE